MTTETDGTVTLRGNNRNKGAWTATYRAFPGAGCQLWQSHLDRTGDPALVFVQFGGDTSGGWDTTLSVLLFDPEGRPFPWQTKGKFDVSERGIEQLVLAGKDQSPAVLVGNRQSNGPGSDHDTYSLYRFAGTCVSVVTGEQEGFRWPSIQNSSTEKWPTLPLSHTLSTSVQSSNGDSIPANSPRFKGIKETNDADRQIVMSNTSFNLPDVLVVDSNLGRKIVSLPTQADMIDLQIDRAKGVALGNNCSDGDCHPVVFWLKQ